MKIRLFIEDSLELKQIINLNKEQSHYLDRVLRAREGQTIHVFNDLNGEFLAKICNVQKHNVNIEIISKNREFYKCPNISIAFAPVKNVKAEYLAVKATELGVRNIYPISTERTIVKKINKGKIKANIIEAAEQCDRLDIPKIYDLTSLKDFMAKLSTETLILADESGAGVTIDSLYKQHHNLTGLIILIGPEGGFSKEERDYIRSYQYSCSLNLGPRILRADTAVISSLALINNYYGDIELKPKFMV
ncbi:MAG: 16S rRNA (uracil(1498)-N(3))-methyltransferase [Alphaproteobacteria bacterium]|jgi:16S rRNA (uracil1498-N3)-methyltransferase|nr:16S rRNA (uracil(1498)-N(3))-methyltransferase [Alphaproteobacteria bacterium]MBT5828010.1 16S rRNA (uracil(1498)-N(3))-methyltransferase [Alphaproteobacteria bacterium]